MNVANRMTCAVFGCLLLIGRGHVQAQDWPQWRGPNRDGVAQGFKVPSEWPKELKQQWKATVGNGDASPSLAGGKLYVFTLEDGQEILRCLDGESGTELWQDKYAAQGASGPASGHAGPRSSPTVAEGKVVTLGVRGTLSCLDAEGGKLLWRNTDYDGSYPRFFTSSSPIVVDGICIAQLGSESNGVIAAFDLTSGKEKWKATDEGTAYSSPVLHEVGGMKVIVAETNENVVGIDAADGKVLWETPFEAQGRGGYNAATPIASGQFVFFSGSGRGTKAFKVEPQGDKLSATEAWDNADTAVKYNSPVLKDGRLFGLTDRDSLFCIDAESGKTTWTNSITGGRGYGSIIDVGPALLALTPSAQLIVYEPSDKEFKELAHYRVADSQVFAHPVVSGNRLYVKDQNSLTLWTIE